MNHKFFKVIFTREDSEMFHEPERPEDLAGSKIKEVWIFGKPQFPSDIKVANYLKLALDWMDSDRIHFIPNEA